MANGYVQAFAIGVEAYGVVGLKSHGAARLHAFEEVKTGEVKVEAKVATCLGLSPGRESRGA